MDQIKVADLDNKTNQLLRNLFSGHQEGYCRFGDKGYMMPQNYKQYAEDLRNMEVREDDIWILGYPRSGTTMTQEMVWLLRNNMDFETASTIALSDRYYFIEFFIMIHEQLTKLEFIENKKTLVEFEDIGYKSATKANSPRHIKTHLPFSLLPPKLLDTAKVIYLARDPRDVAVSYYHQNKLFKFQGFVGNFETYWHLFMEDLIPWTPFFSHVQEAWNSRKHPNLLIIFYEELTKNLPETIRRISKFLEKECFDADIQKLCKHLDINNFKNNQSVHPAWMRTSPLVNSNAEMFIRRGKAGGWRDYFDAKMSEQAEIWIRRNLAGTDLRFPNI